MKKLFRSDLLTLKPYPLSDEDHNEGCVRLHVNESPYDEFNRYPNPRPKKLLQLAADYYGVQTDQILFTRGSDDAIDLLMRLFCQPGQDEIIITPPTFSMYEIYAKIQNATIKKIPLLAQSNFSLDHQALNTAVNERTKLIILCSPNNPTASSIGNEEIIKLCQQYANHIVVVDEAYIEYSAKTSLAPFMNEIPNLVIMRTFSKAHALAGIRCGAIITHSQIIEGLLKVYPPFPFTSHTLQMATQALSKEKLAITQQRVDEAISERNKLAGWLENLSFVRKVWPSDSNFLLFSVDNSDAFYTHCYQQGFILKNLNSTLLPNCLRMSVGTPSQNQQFKTVALKYNGENNL